MTDCPNPPVPPPTPSRPSESADERSEIELWKNQVERRLDNLEAAVEVIERRKEAGE